MTEGSPLPLAIPHGPDRKPWRTTLSTVAVSAADGNLLVSPPVSDPLQQDIAVPKGINPAIYQVPSSGLSQDNHDRAIAETTRVVKQASESFVGFMHNQDFIHSCTSPLHNLMLNNSGDPFLPGNVLSFQAKWMERSVLDYYASLWNAKWPHDPADDESYWGYVLTMGSTEGNLHALWSARNYLSGRFISSNGSAASIGKVPVALFSRYSNSSLHKLCDITNFPTFDVVGQEEYPNKNPLGGDWIPGVPCTGGNAGPGTVDISALEKLVDFFSSRGHPIFVVFNYGTTFKGSFDNVKSSGERLISVLKKNGMYERVSVGPKQHSKGLVRKGFWFHVDGALGASYMPFLEMAYKNNLTNIQPPSPFDFRLSFITSIVTSGHKFIGTPWPCGVYIVRHRNLVGSWSFQYTGSCDKTISLSRNGHSVILLWSYISLNSYDAQVSTVLNCFSITKYVLQCLKDLQMKLSIDLWISYTSPSLSVVFRRPVPHIVQKYTLSCSTFQIDSQVQHVCQIYILKHVTKEKVDALIEDLQAPGAFCEPIN